MRKIKTIIIASSLLISSLFSMNAFAGAYPISHVTFNSTGSIVYDMSGDIKFYLSDLKNSQTDFNYLSDYVTTQKTTLESSISSKQTEVTNGKNSIVSKMTSRGISSSSINTNGNSYYEWSELKNGVTLVYNKGKSDGKQVIANAINSKGITVQQNSYSGNDDTDHVWTNTYGCQVLYKASGCSEEGCDVKVKAYNASGSVINSATNNPDHRDWSVTITGILPAGGKITINTGCAHMSHPDPSDYKLIAIPLGY